ncbi:MAG: Fur family transcriptional regulator [Paracoccaceae bacterium]
MNSQQDSVAAFLEHNHRSCCSSALGNADRLAKDSGLRFTPVRRRTLEILLEEHRAMGAYQVLERLAQDGFGKQPPVAYRALEFLVENGLVHRISRLNAFVACTQADTAHAPIFFICSSCNIVAEAPVDIVGNALRKVADEIGFFVDGMNIEAVGTCPKCQKDLNK